MKSLKKIMQLPMLMILVMLGCQNEIELPVPDLVAVAGHDQQVLVNNPVTLSGSATGAEGPIIYRWRFKSKPEGSTVELADSDQATAKFTPNVVGLYVLELTVSKNGKSSNSEVKVTVMAHNTTGLKANAGEDKQAIVDTNVELVGSATGANFPVEYQWTLIAKPANSAALLVGSVYSTLMFRPDVAGEYVLQLRVSSGGVFDIDEVKVIAGNPETIIISSDINQDLVLENLVRNPALPDYIIAADVKINARLTVNPGVTIHFEAGKSLTVNPNGSIVAKGTEAEKITFTGKEQVKGFWKGILVYSNNLANEFENVTVSYAGGQSFQDLPNVKANMILYGTDYSGASVKIWQSLFEESDGYGMYVKGRSEINHFFANAFKKNRIAGAYIAANQIHKVDMHNTFQDNGFNGVETGGELSHPAAVSWIGNERTQFLISSDLIINSGLFIYGGSTFAMKENVMIEVGQQGFLSVRGANNRDVSFTALNKSGNGQWRGILVKSSHHFNRIIEAKISYAGSQIMPGMNKAANIAVAPGGTLSVKYTNVSYGLGYGIVAGDANQLNFDVVIANTFNHLTLGTVYPPMNDPQLTSLVGDWMDGMSFNQNKHFVEVDFYIKDMDLWFGGASDPWSLYSNFGTGLKIKENGTFIWAIAQRHNTGTNCLSYSAEYIKGRLSHTNNRVTFDKDYWMSKFVNNCDPEQNAEAEVEGGSMTLRYEVKINYHWSSGMPFWELKIYNPDNTSFSLYRKL
jgi:hypothetical protein